MRPPCISSGRRPFQPHGRRRQGPLAAEWQADAGACDCAHRTPSLDPGHQRQWRCRPLPAFRPAGGYRYDRGFSGATRRHIGRPCLGPGPSPRRQPCPDSALRHALPAARPGQPAVTGSGAIVRPNRCGARQRECSPGCGPLAAGLAAPLALAIQNGARSVQHWLRSNHTCETRFAADHFRNINTPGELIVAQGAPMKRTG